jgi:hypothetical protein
MMVCTHCGVSTRDELGHRIPCQCIEPPVPASSPVTVIRERIEELRRQHANYAAYQADRVREGDNHAVWDSAIDMNLVDYEIKGLEFALRALGVNE